jgi:hypothetical protein
MSIPGLVDRNAAPEDNFHDYFTDYSVYFKGLKIPSHIAVYSPDNNEDGQCVAVLTPEPSLGATKWTINGKWITIGMFRDEGRETGVKPIHDNIRWVRYDDQLVVYDAQKHQLILGETVTMSMTNVGSLTSTVTKIINDYTFITTTTPAGADHGSSLALGSYYQGMRVVNFLEEYVVFRLLPSYRLVTWAFVKDIFDSSTPTFNLQRRSLFEISSGLPMKISNIITADVNHATAYEKNSDSNPPLQRRFNQLYDEAGKPLQLSYDNLGQPLPPNYVDSKYKNNPPKNNNTLDYVLNGIPFNPRVYVYDFYGLEINDPDRGPHNDIDLISRDENILGTLNNIKREFDVYGNPLFTGKLYDEFGNVVVGIQISNAVVTRQNILPLSLDSFNHPVKVANRRISNGI